MKLIKKGAEAELYLTVFQGKKAVLKRRVEKKYRVKELDEYIRRMRTKREARLMGRAGRVIRVPEVYAVFPEKYEIYMEYIDGEVLKYLLYREKKYLREFGRSIALLHSQNIIHGDLTTSNVIVKNGDLYFIDFGLGFMSSRIEDKATDLLCLKRSFFATHPDLGEEGWGEVLEGYGEEGEENVLKRMEQIEKRARYL